MRGKPDRQQSMFIVFDFEQWVSDDHPLRPSGSGAIASCRR